MQPTAPVRLAFYGVFATFLVGGAAAASTPGPSASAANDPCAVSEIARIIGSVATNTGNYLDTHPPTNSALTTASQQQGPQALATIKTYFDANAQAGKDLQAIQQPLTGLAGKCTLPITVRQLLQMMQGTQQAQRPEGPVDLPSPQTATGPRPGPAATPPVAPTAR
jgi:heme-binding protein